MKLALSTWHPASNWMTALLLTLVVTGFGLFAQHRVDAVGFTGHSNPIVAHVANKS